MTTMTRWLLADGSIAASDTAEINVSGSALTWYGSLIVPQGAKAKWTLCVEEVAPRSSLVVGMAPLHGDESNEITGRWQSRLRETDEMPATACGWLMPQSELTVEADLDAGTVAVKSSDGSGFTASERKPEEARLVGIGSIHGHAWVLVVRVRSLRGVLRASLVSCELSQCSARAEDCANAREVAARVETVTALRGPEATTQRVAAGLPASDTSTSGAVGAGTSAAFQSLQSLLAALPGRGAQPGPGMSDVQCVEPASDNYGALYISGGAPVCTANVAALALRAVVRLGNWTTPEPLPGATLTVRIGDDREADLGSHLESLVSFVNEHRARGGGVLVHCGAGISRSAAACCAVLMRRHGISRDEALGRVKRARTWVRPNDHFMEVLSAWA